MEWLPIESAPKATLVLLYFPPYGTIRGRSGPKLEAMIKVDYAHSSFREASHWMPLPPPPQEPKP